MWFVGRPEGYETLGWQSRIFQRSTEEQGPLTFDSTCNGINQTQLQGSIHMIHGEDVSRAILAVHNQFDLANGERWLLTDGRVYDWWDLASAWGETESKVKTDKTSAGEDDENRGPQPKWVRELMMEEGVRALPRPPGLLGRANDSREFWDTFRLEPVRARLE